MSDVTISTAVGCAKMLSPFESGGNFERGRRDPSALLAELRAEREEVRVRRYQLQEMISMKNRQIDECTEKVSPIKDNNVFGWLTGAAVAFIFGLLFSTGVMVACGACGSVGLSGFCILIGLILAARAWGEYKYVSRRKQAETAMLEKHAKECEKYNAQLYSLLLREAELDESIRSAQRFM